MPPTAEPPAAPATTPTPAPAPEVAPTEFMGQEMADFAAMDAGQPEPSPEPAPADKPRDDKGKFTKPPEKPVARVPEKPVEQPLSKPQEKPAEKPAVKPEDDERLPTRMGELGDRYKGLKKKVREELEPEIQRLRAKVNEYESKPTEDAAPVLEKIKTLETQNADLERRLALLDYEQSQEFSTKYDQPYRQMWERAANAFSQLTVKEPAGTDEATGEPKFTTRRATEADLVKLGSKPLSELDEEAQRMFGASAPRAIQYIEKLRDLAEARETAKEEAKTKAGQWRSEQQLATQARQKNLATAWEAVNKGLQEKFPKAFEPEATDAEDVAAHTKGFALANLLFLTNTSLTPEQVEALPPGFKDAVKANKPLSELQKVQLHALARLKMANHDRLIAARKRDQARIAELEKTLKEYEESSPSAKRAGTAGKMPDLSPEEQIARELQELDK